jgi:hypothetical protein
MTVNQNNLWQKATKVQGCLVKLGNWQIVDRKKNKNEEFKTYIKVNWMNECSTIYGQFVFWYDFKRIVILVVLLIRLSLVCDPSKEMMMTMIQVERH